MIEKKGGKKRPWDRILKEIEIGVELNRNKYFFTRRRLPVRTVHFKIYNTNCKVLLYRKRLKLK